MIFKDHARSATKAAKAAHAQWMQAKPWDTATLDALVGHLPGWAPAQHGQAYGIILIDAKGRVLLRRPTGCFGGAAWTFAKGRGTLPATTALTELGEETGRTGAIYALLPDAYRGTTTRTNYFVGRATGYRASLMDDETEATCWMTYGQALRAINQSNPRVAARDTAVLHATYATLKGS